MIERHSLTEPENTLRQPEQVTLERWRHLDLEAANRTIENARKYAQGQDHNGYAPIYPVDDNQLDIAINRLMIGSHVGRCGL